LRFSKKGNGGPKEFSNFEETPWWGKTPHETNIEFLGRGLTFPGGRGRNTFLDEEAQKKEGGKK